MKVAVIGGGAAGFFLALMVKAQRPEAEVTILERGKRVLRKVAVSGGGRCNCTNTFEGVKDLQQVYPRGHRLMKRLMKGFSQKDAYDWFEHHGVRLTTQEDYCVFPASQDSATIINFFLAEARRLGVRIQTETAVRNMDDLKDYDCVAVTTGGATEESLAWLKALGHETVKPVPSLFTFETGDEALHALMGTVVEEAQVMIPGTKLRAEGALLVTHWGMSGPAILRLSSYAARYLAERNYKAPLAVNWTGLHDHEALEALTEMTQKHPQKQLLTVAPCGLTARLWGYLARRCLGQRAEGRWGSLNKKEINRLANTLGGCALYDIQGRAPFKEEFVTCGGISLESVNPTTLESRHVPALYFAGELLDIDGVTGGFNFQAAWTTAFTAAQAIIKI